MGKPVILAEGLGKLYHIGESQRYLMFRDILSERIVSGVQKLRGANVAGGNNGERNRVWALKDVSFGIPPGQSVGVIGANGAGKTTLLKILSRITAPTQGRVRMYGRVGSLLEVGTGFHPELSGRENIYLNGAVLGMRRKEINRKFDEIVAFSEVEKFLDTPVKHFSTGMRMRLAFSVAAHLEPEILLVDEVLAVGDVAFQRKSLDKMGAVVGHGRTVLFVSHNMAAVRALCQSAIYFEHGRIAYFGEVGTAIEKYLNQHQMEGPSAVEFKPNPSLKVQILSVAVEDADEAPLTHIPHDQSFWVRLKFQVRSPVHRSYLALHVLDSDLNNILTVRDIDQHPSGLIARTPGIYTYRVRLPAPCLVPGNYRLAVDAHQNTRWRPRILDRVHAVWPFEIFDNGSALSRVNVPWEGKFIVSADWQALERQEPEGSEPA